MRVSDYIVQTLEMNGIDTSFSITGGFAMHLNDSFGRSSFKIHYQHHEQACGYSAVGYSKACGRPSVVCTTAGVAAMNAMSPCLVAYQDSVPILFISGQVKSNETIRSANTDTMKLRHYAGADCDIIDAVKGITKFSHEITSVSEVPDVMTRALNALYNGRPGPVWLSVPVDIQGMQIDSTCIKHVPILLANALIDLTDVYSHLKSATRPLLLVGNGVKLAHCRDQLVAFITTYQIPCVFTILSSDLLETDHPLNIGKVGLIGDRHGNFAVQNCDLLISLGCRMAQGIVGYRPEWFSRESKRIYIDNDSNEIQKTNIRYDVKICAGLGSFFSSFKMDANPDYSEWVRKCIHWKNRWIFETPELDTKGPINPYHALKALYRISPGDKITIASSGSIVTNVWHMLNIKQGDVFIHSSQGDMGFELPAAIGAQIAHPDKRVITILGEGSLQLNIQELQTISQYRLPIKILVFNNGAYGAIEMTQKNFFSAKFGVDVSSGISFPDTSKISAAYEINYIALRDWSDIDSKLRQFLDTPGTVVLEVFCCIQVRYPRLSAIKNEDGRFTNRPLEDMYPFLERDDIANEMLIPMCTS